MSVGLPSFDSLVAELASRPLPRCAVVVPHSATAMSAVAHAVATGAQVDLVGEGPLIRRLTQESGIDPNLVRIHEAADVDSAVKYTADLVRAGEVSFVVKGSLPTATLLGGLLRERLPRRGACASHVYVMHLEAFGGRTVMLTDAGVNIAPALQAKAAIIDNAAALFRTLLRRGTAAPRVAVLSAVEKVNAQLPSTLDAAALRVMAERGQTGPAHVDGPLPLDAALLPDAAAQKRLTGEVAGHADILLAPDLDSGNLLAKALIGRHTPAMGVVLGTGVPVALPSRGDTVATRQHSFYLAAYLTQSADAELERTL